MTEETRPEAASAEQAFTWPGPHRARQAAEAADRAAQRGLERLRATKPRAGAADPPTPSVDASQLDPEPELPAGIDEWEAAPDAEAPGESVQEEGIAEAIIEQVMREVAPRLRQEAADAVELLRAERERLEDTLEWLQELVAEAEERVWQAPGVGAGAVEDDDGAEPRGLPEGAEVDLNRASHGELRALGMSETQASRVIRHRDLRGEFRSVDELDHVAGFIPHFRDQLKQQLVVSPDGEPPG